MLAAELSFDQKHVYRTARNYNDIRLPRARRAGAQRTRYVALIA